MTTFTQPMAEQTIANLRELYSKLYLLNPLEMSPRARSKWSQEFRTVSDALMVLESRALADINDRLADDATAVVLAIDSAEDALHGILEAQTILRVIGGILSTIGTIALLA